MDNAEIVETVRSHELQQTAHDCVSGLFQGPLRTQWEALDGQKLKRPLEELSARVGKIDSMYATAIASCGDDTALHDELVRQCFEQQCLEIKADVPDTSAVPAIVHCLNVLSKAAFYIEMLDLSLGRNEMGQQDEFLHSKLEVRGYLTQALTHAGLTPEEADLLVERFESEVTALNQSIEQKQRSGEHLVPDTGWVETYQALCEQVTQSAKPAMHALRELPGMDAVYGRAEKAADAYGVDDRAFQAASAHIRELLFEMLPNIDVPAITAHMKEAMPEFDAQIKGDTLLYRDMGIAMSLEVLMETKLRVTLAEYCDKPTLKAAHQAESAAMTVQIQEFLQIAAGEGKAGATIKAEAFDRAIRSVITSELGIGAGRS